jgi:LysR family hydrogen peroxide-inducible transcriptional activator
MEKRVNLRRKSTGRLDLVLIALPFETGSLTVMPLFEDGYQLASPPDWPTPHGVEALTQSGQLMLLEKGHCLQRHALAAYPGRISTAADSFAATSLTTLIAMVSEGLGITLLPNLAIDAVAVGKAPLQLTLLPDACPRRVALAWRPGSARTEVFEKLGDFLRLQHLSTTGI